MDYNRRNGDECLRVEALSLINLVIRFLKVVHVFLGDDVHANTLPSHRRLGNKPGRP